MASDGVGQSGQPRPDAWPAVERSVELEPPGVERRDFSAAEPGSSARSSVCRKKCVEGTHRPSLGTGQQQETRSRSSVPPAAPARRKIGSWPGAPDPSSWRFLHVRRPRRHLESAVRSPRRGQVAVTSRLDGPANPGHPHGHDRTAQQPSLVHRVRAGARSGRRIPVPRSDRGWPSLRGRKGRHRRPALRESAAPGPDLRKKVAGPLDLELASEPAKAGVNRKARRSDSE